MLNDQDQAILSEFSYIDLPANLDYKSMSLKKLAEHLASRYKDLLSNNQLQLLSQISQNPQFEAVKLVSYQNNDKQVGNVNNTVANVSKDNTGFVAMGFVSENQAITVFRGSEPLGNKYLDDQVDDWVDNLKNMMLGEHSNQYDQASKFYEDMMKLNKGMEPVVVGHSKGGNLAAYIASKYGNCTAYLFNPMPLHKELVNLENLKTCKIKTRVAENDFIASLLSLFTAEEIEDLLGSLTKEELTYMIKITETYKEKGVKLVFDKPFLDFIGKLKDNCPGIYQRLSDGKEGLKGIQAIIMKLESFDHNFEELLKGDGPYFYPGEVKVIQNDLSFVNMIDAHGAKNFYQSRYSLLQINYSNIEEVKDRLDRINERLDDIDDKLNFLLFTIIIDFNPFDLIQNMVNGTHVFISDLKIKKSRDLVQCQKWLSELERGFKANEKDLMTLLDKLAI